MSATSLLLFEQTCGMRLGLAHLTGLLLLFECGPEGKSWLPRRPLKECYLVSFRLGDIPLLQVRKAPIYTARLFAPSGPLGS